METFVVIKAWFGLEFRYLSEGEMSNGDYQFAEHTPYHAKRFENDGYALAFLEKQRVNYYWGGVYQIERIYVSR